MKVQVQGVVQRAAKLFGGVDIVINNAQGIAPLKPLDEKPDEDLVEDIGGAAMLLASDEGCYINGHPIYADGGQFLNLGVFSPGVEL